MNDDANPYAPPAPEEERDSDVVLARNEAYRVVGNKLYCRRGMERFPGICWLTGSTEQLVGVHSEKGRYLSKRTYWLSVALSIVAKVSWIVALIQVHAPLTIFYAGLAVMFATDSVLNRIFGKPYEFVVGETELARTNRRRMAWITRGSTLIAICSIGTVLLRAEDVVPRFLIVLLVISMGTLALAYLWIRPRYFAARGGDYSDNVMVVHGLTKEFLESLQPKEGL